MLDYDFSESLPSIDKQFCAAILYDGFTISSYARVTGTSLQTNTNNVGGNDYWRSVYDMKLDVTDSVIILVDMDS